MSRFSRLAGRWPGPAAELRVLAASGQLGLGIPEAAFRRGVARKPHVIAADMGSIDPGPAYLGSGRMAAPEALVRRDLDLVLSAADELDVPLLIGSAGTAGAAPHLDAVLGIVREIAARRGLRFRLASIRSDIPAERVLRGLRDGGMTAIGALPLDEASIADTAHIVAQSGCDAFRRALEADADVIVAGRACDTAPFAVVPVMLGYPDGVARHMAKILECTSLCCEPGGRDAMLATLRADTFVLESMNPDRQATPRSVAAHALYEQPDPFSFSEPEGTVRLDTARYDAVDERRVEVSCALWEPAARPTLKIEGARRIGERAVLLAAAADPSFIAQSAEILAAVDTEVRKIVPGDWTLSFRRYGIDGVTDWPEPETGPPREIFLLGECVAEDAATARTALAAVRQQLLHFGFPGRLSTGGNLALPLAPSELDAGAAYVFSIYHILQLDGWDELAALFPVYVETIGDTA